MPGGFQIDRGADGDLRHMLSLDSLAWFVQQYVGDSDPTGWRATCVTASTGSRR